MVSPIKGVSRWKSLPMVRRLRLGSWDSNTATNISTSPLLSSCSHRSFDVRHDQRLDSSTAFISLLEKLDCDSVSYMLVEGPAGKLDRGL